MTCVNNLLLLIVDLGALLEPVQQCQRGRIPAPAKSRTEAIEDAVDLRPGRRNGLPQFRQVHRHFVEGRRRLLLRRRPCFLVASGARQRDQPSQRHPDYPGGLFRHKGSEQGVVVL